MRRLVPFGSALLYLLGTSALGAQTEYEIFQPVESRSKIILESTRGKARVERDGAGPQRVALRSDELLTTIAETRGGWTAAGIREKGSATRLILINRSARGTRRINAPELQRHRLQLRPMLAVQAEQMEGMAWLEGSDTTSLSVRVATRNDSEWSEVIVVGPPARGSQTGLVNTVLADGNWLLVWSAFDGNDDELLWSVGREDRWSVAAPVAKDNSVPDVTPTLVATPDGALLVWSRVIRGEYRLVLSRFRSGSWSRPAMLGPAGSLDPGFAVQDGQLLLLYRHAWPRGWAINEISTEGRIQRFAVVPDEGSSRPALMSTGGQDMRVRFSNRRQKSVQWEALP